MESFPAFSFPFSRSLTRPRPRSISSLVVGSELYGTGLSGGGDEGGRVEEGLLDHFMIGVAGGLVARVIVSRAAVCMRDRLDRLPCLRYPENWRRPGWDCGLVIRSRGRWGKCG